MAEFSTLFSCCICAIKLGHKQFSDFLSYQFRPQAPDMACGLVRLHYVMLFTLKEQIRILLAKNENQNQLSL